MPQQTNNNIEFFHEYQERAMKLAFYPGRLTGISPNIPQYPLFKLAGETGELLEKVGKALRDGVENPEQYRQSLLKELGDILWYVTAITTELGSSLEEVAQMNLEKLESRSTRGKLKGSGDDR